MQKFFVVMLLAPVALERRAQIAHQLALFTRVEAEKVERELEASGIVAVVRSLEKAQRIVKVLQEAGLSVRLLEPLEDADFTHLVEVSEEGGRRYRDVAPVVSPAERHWEQPSENLEIAGVVGGFMAMVVLNIILYTLFGGGFLWLFWLEWLVFYVIFGNYGWSSAWLSMSIMLLLWPLLMFIAGMVRASEPGSSDGGIGTLIAFINAIGASFMTLWPVALLGCLIGILANYVKKPRR